MWQADITGGNWMVNPNGHPKPTLPDQQYLEGPYLEQIRRSSPDLLGEAEDLIAQAKSERWGEPTEYPRDRNMI